MVNYSGDGGIAVFSWPTRWKTMRCLRDGLADPASGTGSPRSRHAQSAHPPASASVRLVGLRHGPQIGSARSVGGTVHIAAACRSRAA
jgi:hypothetical protein